MRYLSVCSGIEAASVAWHDLGWTPIGFSEIERFPSEVLATHYPHVPNLGDMTRFKEWGIERGSVDLIVGGTPCQSFSVAGFKRGLDDPRGNLMLVYVSMVEYLRPEWIVWENVPGVLSSNKGRDFGTLLGALAHIGYGWTYRVFDAQYFGVPQRRRRVFLVGHSSGDPRRAAEILLEPQCVRGNTPTSRGKKKESPTTLERGTAYAFEPGSIARYAGPADINPQCPTLRADMGDNRPAVILKDDTHNQPTSILRRLMPIEWERLQGFPDGWTDIHANTTDTHRYKALGNSMAVPCMRWIGTRINNAK